MLLRTQKPFLSLTDGSLLIFRYPIYRIPTGPTLRDLDACFLTYHSLSTQFAAGASSNGPRPATAATATAMMWLPTFAMASYKVKAAAWTPGWRDRQVAASLAQAADACWLDQAPLLHVIQSLDFGVVTCTTVTVPSLKVCCPQKTSLKGR